jgi:replicative DNA helicase
MSHDAEKKNSGRLPPHNYEAEQSVLGSILLDNESFSPVVEVISAEDFYRKNHQTIFAAMVALYNRNDPLDILTLTSFLNDNNILAESGGAAYIASLTSIVPVTAHIGTYAKIIKEKALLRNLISASHHIADRCYFEQDEIEELLDDAEKRIFDIARVRKSRSFEQLGLFLPSCFARIEQLAEAKSSITGVSSGFVDLDKYTAGFQDSDLIVLAGRPSMGKTAFALNIVQHVTIEKGEGVAFFSLEMSREQLAMRLLSSVGHIDSQKIRTGRLYEEDWPKLIRSVGILEHAPIYIDDTPAISVPEMRSKIRRLVTQLSDTTIRLVVLDYLQLMQSKRSENRTQEISDISRSLKALAKELDIPVLALSQLNRGLESRTDKRPVMADLRESGAIEQDADVICFIYRDEVYNKAEDNPEKGFAEIIVGKQRNGPTGVVKLFFHKEYTMFENYTPLEEPH